MRLRICEMYEYFIQILSEHYFRLCLVIRVSVEIFSFINECAERADWIFAKCENCFRRFNFSIHLRIEKSSLSVEGLGCS